MNIRKNSGWLIHIAIWAVILAMPFFSPQPGRALHGGLDYSRFLPVTISFVIVFYTNYLFLIKHFLSNKRFGAFLFWNMLLITKVSIGVHLFSGTSSRRTSPLHITPHSTQSVSLSATR